MRVRGLETIRSLIARGLVEWTPAGTPCLHVPPALAGTMRQDRQTIEAVVRRAAAFARQLAVSSPDPFVHFRVPRWAADGCPSCGGPVGEHDLRCELCALAVVLALNPSTRTEDVAA